jgi:hypothetical protein
LRKEIYEVQFKGFFGGKDLDREKMTQEEIELMETEDFIEQESGFSRWNWLAIIDKLSGGDPTKHQQVYELNYIACLNILSYWKERDIKEQELLKQIKQNKK